LMVKASSRSYSSDPEGVAMQAGSKGGRGPGRNGARFVVIGANASWSLTMKLRLSLLIVILVLAGARVLQGAGPDVQWLGVLWTRGGVAVGNVAVSSGTTVVPGDVISTSAGSSAWIRFR